jgi:hypothetical protein
MFVLIRQQQERICANLSGQLTATIIVGNNDPDLGGGSGDGDPRSGPGSLGEPAPIYSSSNVSDIDISQLNQRVSCCTDDVALEPSNVSPCLLTPKDCRANLRTS